jgi:hypothetical protein
MKIAVVAMVAIAGSASADFTSIDRSDYIIYTDVTATPIGVDSAQRGVGATVYSNMTSDAEGFFNLAAGPADGDGVPQTINVDDYQSIAPGGGLMAEFQFVGGVTVAGGAMFFDFFDAGGTLVDGFGVLLPQAGNFIWTINITNNDVAFAGSGFVQASIDDDGAIGPATGGSWFLTADDATVGDNLLSAGFGSPLGADLNHAFQINAIPAPASAALLGLGGLAAVRRRR